MNQILEKKNKYKYSPEEVYPSNRIASVTLSSYLKIGGLQKAAHHMYFVALLCPPALDEKILRYKKWMRDQFGCAVALKSPAHITLIPPFWLPDSDEVMLLETQRSFITMPGELAVRINGFSHFNKRVLFAAVERNPELEQLKRQTEDHFINAFPLIKKDKRTFHPHITIANRDMKPSDFDKAWVHFAIRSINEWFVVETASLLKMVDGRWVVIGKK